MKHSLFKIILLLIGIFSDRSSAFSQDSIRNSERIQTGWFVGGDIFQVFCSTLKLSGEYRPFSFAGFNVNLGATLNPSDEFDNVESVTKGLNAEAGPNFYFAPFFKHVDVSFFAGFHAFVSPWQQKGNLVIKTPGGEVKTPIDEKGNYFGLSGQFGIVTLIGQMEMQFGIALNFFEGRDDIYARNGYRVPGYGFTDWKLNGRKGIENGSLIWKIQFPIK